jgi:hypothetical protein
LNSLTEAGVLRASPPGSDEAEFSHQLFGDYLASLCLVRDEKSWQPAGLDALTFSAESFDPVTLAAEQITSTEVGDGFLRSVYDWNWRAAVDCLLATDSEAGPFSAPSRLIVLGLLSERRGDPVDGTARRAARLLSMFRERDAVLLADAPPETAPDRIERVEYGQEWFSRWLGVFCRERFAPWTDDELLGLGDRDPLQGWTVSYVLKRSTLADDVRQHVKGIYWGAMADPGADTPMRSSVRWRAIHALGVAPTQDVLTLLLNALDSDPYPWVRWGAARSVTELAARSEDGALTARALEALEVRAPRLPEPVAAEIAWVAQYRGANSHFAVPMRSLLEALRRTRTSDLAAERWGAWLQRFDDFWADAGQSR